MKFESFSLLKSPNKSSQKISLHNAHKERILLVSLSNITSMASCMEDFFSCIETVQAKKGIQLKIK